MTAFSALRWGLSATALYLSRRRPHSHWLVVIPVAQAAAAVIAALRNKQQIETTGTIDQADQAA